MKTELNSHTVIPLVKHEITSLLIERLKEVILDDCLLTDKNKEYIGNLKKSTYPPNKKIGDNFEKTFNVVLDGLNEIQSQLDNIYCFEHDYYKENPSCYYGGRKKIDGGDTFIISHDEVLFPIKKKEFSILTNHTDKSATVVCQITDRNYADLICLLLNSNPHTNQP